MLAGLIDQWDIQMHHEGGEKVKTFTGNKAYVPKEESVNHSLTLGYTKSVSSDCNLKGEMN